MSARGGVSGPVWVPGGFDSLGCQHRRLILRKGNRNIFYCYNQYMGTPDMITTINYILGPEVNELKLTNLPASIAPGLVWIF